MALLLAARRIPSSEHAQVRVVAETSCPHPRSQVCRSRSFFHMGGLELTANVAVDRPGVKELAGLSGTREQIGSVDRQ
jgi:hypothetical protein